MTELATTTEMDALKARLKATWMDGNYDCFSRFMESSAVDYPFVPADVVELFRQSYGPATRAFTALGEDDRAALRAELVELWTSHNQANGSARTVVDAEYLEVVGIRA